MADNSPANDWSVDNSAELYRIDHWGNRYFTVDDRGHLVVQIDDDPLLRWDLAEVVEACEKRGISAPLLIRFTPVVESRVRELHRAFARAIDEYGYQGAYHSIYPIKVNQHREVIDAYMKAARPCGGGLEAGSRAELLAVIAMADNRTPILCNGFKDAAIVEMALRATRIGRRVTLIIDRPEDVPLVIETARRLAICPRLGLRVKLAARSSGRWKGSVGNRAKFGLTMIEMAVALEQLTSAGLADRVHMLHFHPGSQVNRIRNIKSCVVEATRIYADLVRQGIGLDTIDVGGGLAIDYTGDRNSQPSSMNYTMQEYANDVVYYVHGICEREQVPHPVIYSESGRSLVAHHSVLVFPVISTRSPASRYRGDNANQSPIATPPVPAGEQEPLPLTELRQILEELAPDSASESWHDAQQAIEMAQQLFINGHLSLQQRTFAEDQYARICLRIRDMMDQLRFVPEELQSLKTLFAETYLANFSVFQALPDHWAIGQVFPVMPIHRLDENPERNGVIADITCDSDGKIGSYIGDRRTVCSLPLHQHHPGQPYWLGVFLVGAYQEALSDDHNLFGKFHTVTLDGSEDWRRGLRALPGSDLREVLEHVHHDVQQMLDEIDSVARQATSRGRLTGLEARETVDFFRQTLNDYTYLLENTASGVRPTGGKPAKLRKTTEPATL